MKKNLIKGLVATFLLTAVQSPQLSASTNGVELTNCKQLSYLESNSDYYLSKDLDCSGINVYPQNMSFNGTLDGNGYTISSFNLSDSLFNSIGNGVVTNINFADVTLTNLNQTNIGIIASENKGTIENVTIKNSTIYGQVNTGAIAGNNSNTINNVTIDNVAVTTEEDDAGGIVGVNNGSIVNSTVTNNSVITGRQHVGGIAGLQYEQGTISNSLVNGSKTTIKGTNFVGGLVGDNNGQVVDTTVDGIRIRVNSNLIDFKEQYNFGGLIGKNQDDGYVNNSNVSNMNISIDGYAIGGFVGQNDGLIEQSIIESSTVEGTDNTGGFAGNNYGEIFRNQVDAITVTAENNVGGFIGFDDDYTKQNAVSNTVVNGINNVGGYIGNTSTDSKVKKSFVENTVINGISYVGGFIGNLYSAEVEDSYANATVNGDKIVGGFAGEISAGSIVERGYSTGDVTAVYSDVGGFAGKLWSNPKVRNSFTTSNVTGYTTVGKFTSSKHKKATITNCYYYDGSILTSDVEGYQNSNIKAVDASTLASSTFYSNTLQFETDRWDLGAEINVDNLPKVLI